MKTTRLPKVLRIYVVCYDYAFLWILKQKTTVVRKNEDMKYDEALSLAKINAECGDPLIWRCAIKLCNDIFAVLSKQICEPVTVDNIMKGEAFH